MSKFFKKLKRQKSKNDSSLQSPPVTSVATQSEPLPLSFHLDGLLNCSRQSSRVSCNGEDLSGSQGSGGHEEVDGNMYHANNSLEQSEDRGLNFWPGNIGDNTASESSQEPVFNLPPPLIPSPPFTLSPSPLSPTYPVLPDVHANCSVTHVQLPSAENTAAPHTNITSPPTASAGTSAVKPTRPPHIAGDVNGSVAAAWTSTLLELGKVLGHRREQEESPNLEIGEREMDNGHWELPCDRERRRESQVRESEETRQCRVALESLKQRETRLMAEVTELRTEIQTNYKKREDSKTQLEEQSLEATTTLPHPETVVADLQESLRQTEKAVEAVQGERDGLREGVDRMKDELRSLHRSNSLLIRRKQQWMEVASQVRVVLEENHNLLSQFRAQQHIITDLRTQQHSKIPALERELSQMEECKKSVECQLNQMMAGQALLFRQVARLVGVAVTEADSPRYSDSLQSMASLLERYADERNVEMTAQQDRVVCLKREKMSLERRVEDARAVISQMEGEMGLVQSVVREGEDAVVRLRGQLEEVQEREETSQQQLAHAITQVDKAIAERDAYARIARRWQAVSSHGDRERPDSSRALEEARLQLQQQAQEHRSQRKRYKTEIHRLRGLLASMQEGSSTGEKRYKSSKKERPHVHTADI